MLSCRRRCGPTTNPNPNTNTNPNPNPNPDPDQVWPDYPCEEQEGRGWLVQIEWVAEAGGQSSAKVRFVVDEEYEPQELDVSLMWSNLKPNPKPHPSPSPSPNPNPNPGPNPTLTR